jgi:hypothetical protein
MKIEKGQYINLANGSLPKADGAEVKFNLDSQVVQLSCRRWGWVWTHPRGVFLQQDHEHPRRSFVDFTPFLQGIIHGVSVLLAIIEVIKRFFSGRPETNGGFSA